VLFAIGVVEMLTRGKDLDGLRSAPYQAIQQAGM
jgi:hypothetical protein